jgi:hypothetical protein
MITLEFEAPTMLGHPARKRPTMVTIDVQASTFHADRVVVVHPDFETAWNTIDTGLPAPMTMEARGPNAGSGVRHLAGLIDMTLKLHDLGMSVCWRYPESMLHPKWQCGLGDLVIYLDKRRGLFDKERNVAPTGAST